MGGEFGEEWIQVCMAESLHGRGVRGRVGTYAVCIHMHVKAESLPCSPETGTALLIGSTPAQNKKGKQ